MYWRNGRYRPEAETSGLRNYFFKDDSGTFTLGFMNNATNGSATAECPATPLVVIITVEGVADEFLTGLAEQTFELPPGEDKNRVDVNDLLDRLPFLERDQMWGIKVQATGYQLGRSENSLVDESFYVYRFVDAADAVRWSALRMGLLSSPILSSTDLAASSGNGSSISLPRKESSRISILDLNFDTDEAGNLVFDPQVVGNLISGTASVMLPAGDIVGTLQLKGDGTPKIRLDINKAQFKSKLEEIVTDALTPEGNVNSILFHSDGAGPVCQRRTPRRFCGRSRRCHDRRIRKCKCWH